MISLSYSNGALSHHLVKSQSEIQQTFQLFQSLLEEQRQECLNQLENAYAAKHGMVAGAAQKANAAAEKLQEVRISFSSETVFF